MKTVYICIKTKHSSFKKHYLVKDPLCMKDHRTN